MTHDYIRHWMLRAACAAVVLGSASAQQLDLSRLRPVRGVVQDAGVYDWDRRSWRATGSDASVTPVRTIYRNDCTWTGGSFFYAPEHCEDLVSQGSIPSPTTPGAPLGVTEDNVVTKAIFGYCTEFMTGAVDVKLGFYDNLGGDCAGMTPVRPPTLASQASPMMPALAPLGTATAYFDLGAASGYPLPGSTTSGVLQCYTFTLAFGQNSGFCLQSEGDGKWDNDAAVDKFSWSWRSAKPPGLTDLVTGPFIKGEPSSGAFGSGTYNIPPGSNGIIGGACGTGLGTEFDQYWLNVDGSKPGVTNTLVQATGVSCKDAASTGTNCYWFGGWPGGPLSAFWMTLQSEGDCSGCRNRAVSYCTAGTSADGCRALVTATGSSSATAASGFTLSSRGVQGAARGTRGLFVYSGQGRQAARWGNGTSYLCTQPPLVRTPNLDGGGTVGACDASFATDLNALWTAQPSLAQPAGATLRGQLWYRDPHNTSNQVTSLSNAVEWTVCP